MSSLNDFLKARTEIQTRITKLETDLEYWRDELKAFDRVETTMRRLGAKDEPAALKLEPDPPRSKDDQRGKDNQLTIMKSFGMIAGDGFPKRGELKSLVLKTVLEHKGPVSSTKVEQIILQSGYKPAGKNFDISVYKTLNRLSEQGLIESVRHAGHVRFQNKIE